ncbi:hypothetical protein ABZ656_39785 [Streptomyces sp. NPDC007095]|jgi:pimeloyl-ACP methyl ester carboxylesterase|uniref:alpha/beta fold hydrolase n=1 Tax=Streptomyces sp. NPDC007095 TaxID=3154482 RepID=UPI000CBE6211
MTGLTGISHDTVQRNAIKQYWLSAGQGPPVHLLHGYAETWFGRRKQIPVLAEQFTAIGLDLRGYGDTGKPASGYDKRTLASTASAGSRSASARL